MTTRRHARLRPGNLCRQTCQRHERVHEIGMQFAPQPGMHSAHRRSHHQSRVIYAKAFGEQSVIRLHHVEVTVTREFRAHAVARFARFAMTDPVRQHDEKFRRVEWLIFSKKLAGKFRANKLRAAAGCPVHDQNRIGRFALRIFLRFSERPIMDAQLRQCFAGLKFEIGNREIAFGRRGIICGGRDTRNQDRWENYEDSDYSIHVNDYAVVRLGFV